MPIGRQLLFRWEWRQMWDPDISSDAHRDLGRGSRLHQRASRLYLNRDWLLLAELLHPEQATEKASGALVRKCSCMKMKSSWMKNEISLHGKENFVQKFSWVKSSCMELCTTERPLKKSCQGRKFHFHAWEGRNSMESSYFHAWKCMKPFDREYFN